MHEHWAPPPDPRLRGLVTSVSGYRYDGFAPGVHVGLPGPALTVIVPFDEPIRVAAPGVEPTPWTALASGLYDAPVHVHHSGRQHGVQVDLTPAGARALLGVPAGELAGRVVDLSDLVGDLAERASEGTTLRSRVERVLTALLGRCDLGGAALPEVGHAWDELRRTRGTVPVWAVAAQVGWSTRHLGQRFKTEYGISPKTAARLVRCARARRLVRAGLPLAETAVRCGYVDQAHLNRDWRAFVGLSPTRWRREDELAFVQDDAASVGPG